MGGQAWLFSVLVAVMLEVVSGVEVCKVADLRLVTQTGEFFLAVTFLGMGVTTVIFVLMALKASHEKRKFYFTCCYIGMIATFAYYAMLSGQGWIITPSCRQMFYVRYVEWIASTPLLLMLLAWIVGADIALTIAVMGAQLLMIFGGYMAAISSGHIKWLWFGMALLIFGPIIYIIMSVFKGMVERSDASVAELYNKLSWLTVVTWACYPFVFLCSEGTGDWSPNFEIMIFGVLDLMSKSVFGFILLLSHQALDRIANLPRFASIGGGDYGTQMADSQRNSKG
nr:protein 99 [synthetic construct]